MDSTDWLKMSLGQKSFPWFEPDIDLFSYVKRFDKFVVINLSYEINQIWLRRLRPWLFHKFISSDWHKSNLALFHINCTSFPKIAIYEWMEFSTLKMLLNWRRWRMRMLPTMSPWILIGHGRQFLMRNLPKKGKFWCSVKPVELIIVHETVLRNGSI